MHLLAKMAGTFGNIDLDTICEWFIFVPLKPNYCYVKV